ncbi:hypothetical protein [Vulcanococcus sp.]|jgi:hypothetical protein|uniref:hypothetical protein n=1 Tax=Vulcanococcus sp. TaxID=2856995 RepID=UPI003234D9A7
MTRTIPIELTAQEAKLLFNTIRARAIYKPVKLPLGGEIWKPWMEELLQKLSCAATEAESPQ